MKKSQIIVIVFTLLILLGCFLLYRSHDTQEDKSEEVVLSNEKNLLSSDGIVNNYEDGVDLSYNYITNPQELSEFDFLTVGITAYGDEIDTYVKSLGYTSQKLEIINATQNSSTITVTMTIGESGKVLTVNYDNLTNVFSFSDE